MDDSVTYVHASTDNRPTETDIELLSYRRCGNNWVLCNADCSSCQFPRFTTSHQIETRTGMEAMKMAELKPCPFCGEYPNTRFRVTKMGGVEDIVESSIVCPSCGTSKTKCLKILATAKFDEVVCSMEQAADAWNRRADNV